MSEIVLTLGGIQFRDFEVPEQIVFGGTQVLAVHQVIGGDRMVDALGAADGQVELSGVFSGPEATSRAQALDVVRSLGGAVPLAWNGFFFSVFIAELNLAYTKPWWIPFHLKLVVVRDFVAALPTTLGQAALDVASAITYALQGGISITGISAESFSSVNTALGTANTALSSTGANFSQNVTTLNNATDPGIGAGAVQSVANSAGTLAGLANTQAYLGRATTALSGTLG